MTDEVKESLQFDPAGLTSTTAPKPKDPNRKTIKEEDGIHKEWFEQAAKVTIETLGDFVKKLANDYEHDYGTIVHAMAAAVGATMSALNNSDQGGITGFQAGCLMWEILEKEFHVEFPSRLVRFEHMLFPQYEYEFKAIPYDIWVWLRERASQLLETAPDLHESVKQHMRTIADGKVPFGYRIASKDEK